MANAARSSASRTTAARPILDPAARPLGRILQGGGNNGEDGTEGAIYKQAYGCYLHGSLLPKNPWFADHLIGQALRHRYGQDIPLAPLDDGSKSARTRPSSLGRAGSESSAVGPGKAA